MPQPVRESQQVGPAAPFSHHAIGLQCIRIDSRTAAYELAAAYDFPRGDLGLSVPSLYGNVRPIYYYYTFVTVAALCVLLTHVILRSPVGYFMRAVKDDQLRAQSLGVDTTTVKLFAFTLSSAMAGLAAAYG